MGYYDEPGTVRSLRPRGAFTPSPVFLGILAAFVVSGWLAWSGIGNAGVDVFLFVVSGWLLSLCLHEYAHAVVAYNAGDRSVAQRGYLQLNPLKYTHWLFSIALPLLFLIAGGIALPGGAVLIDHRYIRSRAMQTAISLAGPAVNLVFTLALVLPFALGANIYEHYVFWSAAACLAYFQAMAGVFNLLPIPGLDGGNAILPWLSGGFRRGFEAVRPYGFLIMILILWQTSIGQSLVNGIADTLFKFGDLPIGNGLALFRFWSN